MTVIQQDGSWVVLGQNAEELSRHATNADAWKWIERQSNSDWSMAACRHDWSFRTNAQGGGNAAMTDLFAGSLIFGLPLTDPFLHGGVSRSFRRRPSTHDLPLRIKNPRLVGVPPKKQLVGPGPANTLGLDLRLHAGIVQPKRDEFIALSTVKTTRARA